MTYLLDTNICVYLINKRSQSLFHRFSEHPLGTLAISSITLAELKYGVAKSQHKEKNQRSLEKVLLPLPVLPFDERAAEIYGGIRAELEQRGELIGALDLLIAAQALSLGLIVVTNNEKEFRRVPLLRIENWLES